MTDDILFVLPNLSAGGAQRVAVMLLNDWADRGLKCTLVTIGRSKREVHRPAENVELFQLRPTGGRSESESDSDLTCAAAWWTLARRRLGKTLPQVVSVLLSARRLQRIVAARRPKAVVAFLWSTNLATILATRGTPAFVIVSERNDPRRQSLSWPLRSMRRRLYPLASIVTANTLGALTDMADYIPNNRLRYVPNPVHARAMPGQVARRTRFLSVGRLVPQKGHANLIEAFSLIAGHLPDWDLLIVGDGPQRKRLEALTCERGVEGRVRFAGYIDDPTPFYDEAGVFVLPSLYEGMPNALMEAMVSGLASIVTDTSPGPVELVSDGRGYVSGPDVRSLSLAMLRLATDDARRARIGRRAAAHMVELSLGKVQGVWADLLSPAGVKF